MMAGVSGLVVGRGGRRVAGPFEFQIVPGALTLVCGANGTGKTTLLRTLAGLEAPLEGRVDGLPRPLAYVPQSAELANRVPIRVDEVVDLGLDVADRGERRRRVAAGLEEMGILHLARRRFSCLSGGERQRTLIARALAEDARCILLDEPLSGLDRTTISQLWSVIARLVRKGILVVVVTHEQVPDDLGLPCRRIAIPDREGEAS